MKHIVKSHITHGFKDAKKDSHGNIVNSDHVRTYNPGETIDLSAEEAAAMQHAVEAVKEEKKKKGQEE